MATSSIARRLCRPLQSLASCRTQQTSTLWHISSHPYSTEGESADTSSIGNEKVQRLADEITGLTVLEASWLSEILRKKLNIQKPAMGAMPMGFAMPAAAAAPAAGDAEAPKEEKKEKTEFDVKLESFSAEGKIKVIKEIRAITSLGLKEAKELVSCH
jgi:large subunit ribosomal protein L7/L12